MTTAQRAGHLRTFVRAVPRGSHALPWLGPGLLWMVSAVGSGAILFTPRVAARYEYAFAWLAFLVCFFMWIMIREAARYTVVTGRTLLEGFNDLPGPANWPLWVIFLPQLLAAAVGIAGLASLVGSAMHVSVGGSHIVYALVLIGGSTALVVGGGYRWVARVGQVMAGVLVALSVAAAVQVFDSPQPLAEGLVPTLPADTDLGFVLPWVGTILAGSMGIIWYAYWTAAQGFGGQATTQGYVEESGPTESTRQELALREERLDRWLKLSNTTAALGVGLGTAVIMSFTILGAELLAPQNQVPDGINVARDLAQLLENNWGAFGFWALIITSVFALGGSVIANQDGWSRSFADISRLLMRSDSMRFVEVRGFLPSMTTLRRIYAISICGLIPAVLVVLFPNPVTIMTASGVVAAAHTPFIVVLILLVNRKHLPATLTPGLVSTGALASAGLFYAGFAVLRFAA